MPLEVYHCFYLGKKKKKKVKNEARGRQTSKNPFATSSFTLIVEIALQMKIYEILKDRF